MNSYAARVLDELKAKNGWEKEFLQAVEEVFLSLNEVLDQDKSYEDAGILERIVEPERVIEFRVPWRDDNNKPRVNRGYRVQFNSAIGPYKGGLRFAPNVSLSTMKFLGFEQIFKNSLTGLPMGGGKGGADFDPNGKSNFEIERFCQSFMTELCRHIGADTDVPAGDLGVGAREIGYMFGQYKRCRNIFEGVLTGKGQTWGGSIMRPEATGFGVIYFVREMLKHVGQDIAGKRIAVSGFGNVAWGVVKKATELGAKVVTLSGPDGYINDEEGFNDEKIAYMLEMRASGRNRVQDYADKFHCKFVAGRRPWEVACDVAIPAALQNELNEDNAKDLIKNGCKVVCEAANMPCTPEAINQFIANKIIYAPGKAANAGGVATSGLEMTQNSIRLRWTKEEVDAKLLGIMQGIHNSCLEAAEKYGHKDNYMIGANIAGFLKVATAMKEQGHC